MQDANITASKYIRGTFSSRIYIYVDSTNVVNSIDSFKGEHFAPARLERMMYLCMIRMPSNTLVDFITILICKIIEYKKNFLVDCVFADQVAMNGGWLNLQ